MIGARAALVDNGPSNEENERVLFSSEGLAKLGAMNAFTFFDVETPNLANRQICQLGVTGTDGQGAKVSDAIPILLVGWYAR